MVILRMVTSRLENYDFLPLKGGPLNLITQALDNQSDVTDASRIVQNPKNFDL